MTNTTKFAVVETGGKQYLVSAGDSIRIEKIKGAEVGKSITFEKVLLVEDGSVTNVGTPYITGAKIEGIVTEIGRAKKIDVIRYKAKSRYFKKRGHRQPFIKVKIESI